jgi:TFIIF-interacting CTD phosphatase-like protein
VDIIDRNRVIDHRLFRDSCTRTWDPIQRIYLPNVKVTDLFDMANVEYLATGKRSQEMHYYR